MRTKTKQTHTADSHFEICFTKRTKCAEPLELLDPGVDLLHFKVKKRIKSTTFFTQIKLKWESICPAIAFHLLWGESGVGRS